MSEEIKSPFEVTMATFKTWCEYIDSLPEEEKTEFVKNLTRNITAADANKMFEGCSSFKNNHRFERKRH
jgi:hypothetical protein